MFKHSTEVVREPVTLVDLLQLRAAGQPDRRAYTFLLDGETEEVYLTYEELDRQARSIAAMLDQRSASGERALLLYPPGLEYIAAFFGCLYAGVVAVPAYPPRVNRNLLRIQSIASDSQATIALTTAPVLSRIEPLLAEFPELGRLRWLTTDNLRDEISDVWRERSMGADTLAFLQYTSGSTAEPKGVMVTHGNLLHNQRMIQRAFAQTSDSIILGWLPLYHDMGLIGNVLQPLYSGAGCVLMAPAAFLQKPVRWLQAISRYRATTSGGPNFAFDLCVRKIAPEDRERLDLRSWTRAFIGAEPVRRQTLERFGDLFGECGFRREAFYPCYGLAEATLFVSGGARVLTRSINKSALERNRVEVAAAGDEGARTPVSCGQTFLNLQVAIVDPETLTRCAPDRVGEIWVKGPSVARGYWNRPEQSERTFNARLMNDGAGPFLRTGDLGFIFGRELFVTGRLKDLIIIRGRNHYPQDISLTVESSHPALKPGCGAVFSIEVAGEERLVIVHEVERSRHSDADAMIEAIRHAVAEEHELRVDAVALIKAGSAPKTSSGKIQNHVCRARFQEGTLDVVASWEAGISTPGDDAILDVTTLTRSEEGVGDWFISQLAKRLGMDPFRIDVNQPLSRYGVDSLMAIELVHSLETGLGVILPAVSLLKNPTVAELAAEARSQLSSSASPMRVGSVPSGKVIDGHPLTPGQKALWFLRQLEPDGATYNLAGAARVRSFVDVVALRRAFQRLVDRHAALRTTFAAPRGEPVQRVHREMNVCFQEEDASGWSDDLLEERMIEESHHPFDLEQGPLLRVSLFIRSSEEYRLLLVAHHIVADFWSIGTLISELEALYRQETTGVPAVLAPLPMEYIDYVYWQSESLAGTEGARHLAYWVGQLASTPPVLDLPTDRPRPVIQTHSGASQVFRLSLDLTQKLKALARAHDATLYTILVAAFQTLLHRYTGQEQILVGSPTSGRSRAEFAPLVGYFINPVVLRADFSASPIFNEFLDQARQTVLAALEHQDYPFVSLVEHLGLSRDQSRSPLFQAMFILQKAHTAHTQRLVPLALGDTEAKIDLGGLPMEPVALRRRAAQFDLTLMMAETDGGVSGSFEYNTDLFDEATIHRMVDHFTSLLESIVAGPHARIRDLNMLTERERQLLLEKWNDTRTDFPAQTCVHTLFENQVELAPDAIALIVDDRRLTYGELNRRANQLARYLQSVGVGPETLVGLYVERSLEMVLGILGILKAGGAYVPLDPTYPKERLALILKDARTPVLLTQQRLVNAVPEHEACVICLDTGWEQVSQQDESNPICRANAENLAYVIYTSGSTGAPKGVMVGHRNVVNFFTAMDGRIGCEPPGVWLAVTSISFDISVLELLWTLTRGFRVITQGEIETIFYPPEPGGASDKKIDFSLFYFASDERASAGAKYQLLIEGAKFADRHGFSAVWTPERHFHAFGGLYPNPSVTSAAIATITERIQIRAGSVVLPLHNPVRVAEEWSVVDNLSKGRVGLSFASGWHADDFVLSPENYAGRKDTMARGIETVRRLWRGESIRLRGGTGSEVDVKILPQPLQPELPIWITAAGNPDTFRTAGEMGANLLTHLLGQSLEELAEKILIYRTSWRERSRRPGAGYVTLMLHTFIGEDMDAVREKVREPFYRYLESSLDLINNFARQLGQDIHSKDFTNDDMSALMARAFERYLETSGLLGTPGSCLSMVNRLKAIGVDEIACLIDFGVDVDSVMAGLEYLNLVKVQSNEKSEKSAEHHSLSERIKEHKVTHLQCTPSLAKALILDPDSRDALRMLEKLMLGGEALPASLVAELSQGMAGEIHNMYGPTETTVWSVTDLVDKNAGAISLGRPIANTEIYILDKSLQLSPIGVIGELYIGGEGVVRGYHGQPELTAEKFIPDPFGGRNSARLYRTGDVARYLTDGRIEFLGRVDNQVKIRGFRIELEEIEAILTQHPDVREAVVITRNGASGEKRLAAYIVPDAEKTPTSRELRSFLRERVPAYMLPSSFTALNALPLTPNGKVNRRALPAPEQAKPERRETFTAPRSPLEEGLAMIWAEALGLEKISVIDDFFELGGHSLLAAQLISRLRETFQIQLPMRSFFDAPTVAGMAAAISKDPAERMRTERIARLIINVAQFSEHEVETLLNEHALSLNDVQTR